MVYETNDIAPEQVQCVTFIMEDETYDINVMQVQEVLRETKVARVPGSPDYVMGIANLRGNVVSVFEVEQQTMGIPVDSVAEMVDIKMSEIETPPNVGNDESSSYIHGIVSRNNKLLKIIDLNKLLSEAEWGGIAAL